MPIMKGDWKSSTRSYEMREDAARALIFDLSFYADYRFSQVRRLFKQTAMQDVFTKMEINDIVKEAYFQQDGAIQRSRNGKVGQSRSVVSSVLGCGCRPTEGRPETVGGAEEHPLGGGHQKNGGPRSAQGAPLFVEADTRVVGTVFGLVGVDEFTTVPRDPILGCWHNRACRLGDLSLGEILACEQPIRRVQRRHRDVPPSRIS